MDKTRNQDIVQHEKGTSKPGSIRLLMEEPLSIRIEGNPYAVVMRTPGDEIYHAAGFFLSEGLVDHPDDFGSIGFCTEEGVNVVAATLQPERRKAVKNLLDRKGFVSQTSCGICGKELIQDLHQILKPVSNRFQINVGDIASCIEHLVEKQTLYQETRSAHAAMVFSTRLGPMAYAEDVGRHNALDKAVGMVFMKKRLSKASFAVLSSRVSYELVQKAARAKLEIIISLSRPTVLAVELAASLNITLACAGKPGSFLVFCGKDRILPATDRAL